MESGVEDITWRELIDMIIAARLNDFHVALPARVESYDHSAQTVQVTLMVNKMVPDGATPPNYVSESLPKLADVRVQFQRCKQFTMTFPLVAGDFGLVVFGERNDSAWRATGNQSDPGDLGTHTLSSPYFIPGVYPDANPASSADGTNMIIGSDTDGNSRIEVKPTGGMNLGAGATKGVARSGDSVNAGSLTGTANLTTGVVTFIYTDANGTPAAGGTTAIMTGGKITGSSSKINAVD